MHTKGVSVNMGKGATMETNVTTRQFCAISGLFFLIMVGLTLGGCSTTQGQALLNQIGEKSAAEADSALGVAIWGTCKAPTAGALTRKWGSDPEGFNRWAEFCDYMTFPVGGGS